MRLVQGRAGSETEYGSALDAALGWQRDGAEWVHLVDLDAAFGRGSNRELLAEVVGKLDVQVELSGGIRDDDSLTAALATGCARVNLGTAGLIEVDGAMRTTAQGIYAIGDLTRGPALAHKASDEGIIAVEDAAGMTTHPIEYIDIPRATFCTPNVGSFGLT